MMVSVIVGFRRLLHCFFFFHVRDEGLFFLVH
uniref:Uncharacterized protein n=1 Tax=Rhizophora mucronata TaxID=61149 RepID=A0A2P2QJS8_RHIMU